MQRFDIRSEIVVALQSANVGFKRGGKEDTFRCHRHDDATPSAWIGQHAWGCHACVFTEPLKTLAEHYGVNVPRAGFSLEDYADRKRFDADKLRKWGVHTDTDKFGCDVVVIPFHDADGNVLRTKFRTANKTFWGDGQGTYLYGLDMLARTPKTHPVILVEGESDAHAAWHHKVLAVGVPGASGWRKEWAPLFKGRDVYVWQEPDDAGAKLVAAIAADIPTAKIIANSGHKDIADVHRDHRKEFSAKLKDLMSRAHPATHKPPRIAFVPLIGDKLDAILLEKKKPIDAVPTPLDGWNSRCFDAGGSKGLGRGWHVTIGANTGNGKSLLALNLGAGAVKVGERVAFISLEMTDIQLATRYMSIMSGEPVRQLERGPYFDEATFKRAQLFLDDTFERTGGGAMYVNEVPISTLADIEEAFVYQVQVNGCRYVITDYLQLADVTGVRDRVESITIVSHTIRNLARKLGVVSIGLSQFNRETSKDKENPPTPQGLMGGSPLENDSDQVLLLDHTSRVNISDHVIDTQLLLAKNRHGPQGMLPIRWDYNTLRLIERGKDGKPVNEKRDDIPWYESKNDSWEKFEDE